MAKNDTIYLSIILIIAIFNYANCQNIITSWHYDKVQMYDLETIRDILVYDTFKDITFNSFREDSIDIRNLKITSVSNSLYDSYLNYNMGLFLFMPHKVTFSFEYDYSSSQGSGKATFDFNMDMLRMRVRNNKETQTQDVNITADYTENDFSIYDISDKTYAEKIKVALYKGFENNGFVNDKILPKIDLIDAYKKKLSQKADFKFSTGAFLENKEITIKLNRFIGFCEELGKIRKSAICYYSGELENEEDKTDRSNVTLITKFTDSTDYNIFINSYLLDRIGNRISTDGLKEKIYDKTVPKAEIPYDFKFSSLKKYFDGLGTYSDEEEFSTKIKIKEFSTKSAKFNVVFIIKEEEKFNMDVTVNYNLKGDLNKNVLVNLCVFRISNVEVGKPTGTVKIKDEANLKDAISKSFDFTNYPLCLTDEGVSFKDYFSKITSIEDSSNDGIYLFGNQLYQ